MRTGRPPARVEEAPRAGADASRALAKMSFEPSDVARGWPDLGDLDEKAVKILDDWEKLFKRKYPAVGRLAKA